MPTAHFQHLADQVAVFVKDAQTSLQIAVCWFSNRDIFDTLLQKVREGVSVDLIIEYDTQNICKEGLDFQAFIRLGGRLYARREAGLMHHKFAIADGRKLLTGSYNWTYNSNAENILVADDPGLTKQFMEAFREEQAAAERIFTVKREHARPFSAWALFENTRFTLSGLRGKVSGGAGVWVVGLGEKQNDPGVVFARHCLFFDAEGLMQQFWTRWRLWDADLFEDWLSEMPLDCKAGQLRNLRRWARRVKTGDVVLAVVPAGLMAAGIVQSAPQPSQDAGLASFRAVQWLQIFPEPVAFEHKLYPKTLTKYKGSGLRLLHLLFGEGK